MQITSAAPVLTAARRPQGIPADLQYLFEPTDRFERNETSYKRQLGMDMLYRGIFGGALGAALSGVQWYGAVAGAATGAYLAWDKLHRHQQGVATVTADGVVSKHQFYLEPASFQVTAEQREAFARAQGEHVDHIGAAPALPALEGLANPAWNGHAKELVALEKGRRLVADLGGKSEQGQAALHLVDANSARLLMAAGVKVFAVTGQSEDVRHSYTVDAVSPDRQLAHKDSTDWVERKLDYSLTRLQTPADLAQLPAGKGLPEGFLGVYRDATSCSERVHELVQDADLELGKNLHRQTESSERRYVDPQARVDRANGHKLAHYLPLPHYGAVLGALAGTLTATVMFPQQPVPMLAFLAGGVLGGRELGRFLVSREIGKIG